MKLIFTLFFTVVAMFFSGGQGRGAQQIPSPESGLTTQEGQPLQQKGLPVYADVALVFNKRCTMCHRGSQAPLGLRLNSYDNIRAGSQNGPVIVPGNPGSSELVRRILGKSQPRMPLTGPPWLSESEMNVIERWIAAGAPEGEEGLTKKRAPGAVPPKATTADQPITYAGVAPIISKHCVKCHAGKGMMGPPPEGYRLDSYESILASRDRARVIPGSAAASELVRRIRGRSLPRMPFDGPPYLDEAEIELIVSWIAQGARDSDGNKGPVPVGAKVRMNGRLTEEWELDGMPLIVDSKTRLKKAPSAGGYVEVRGIVQSDGRIRATTIRTR
jgi:uncharacterized membrane protein